MNKATLRQLLQRAAVLEAPARRVTGWLECLQPLALLLARWHVGLVFFRSGLTKLEDWSTTLALFESEYAVPLLPPEVAAVAGTTGETLLPLLLFAGLGGRFAAAGLSVVNVVAVLSLPDMPEPAFQLHVFWGCLLLAVLLWGPGRWSVDGWWRQRRGW